MWNSSDAQRLRMCDWDSITYESPFITSEVGMYTHEAYLNLESSRKNCVWCERDANFEQLHDGRGDKSSASHFIWVESHGLLCICILLLLSDVEALKLVCSELKPKSLLPSWKYPIMSTYLCQAQIIISVLGFWLNEQSRHIQLAHVALIYF